MNTDPEPKSDSDKEWDDFANSPMGRAMYRNYGDKDNDSEDDCSESDFQKFCDYHGNNRYPTE